MCDLDKGKFALAPEHIDSNVLVCDIYLQTLAVRWLAFSYANTRLSQS